MSGWLQRTPPEQKCSAGSVVPLSDLPKATNQLMRNLFRPFKRRRKLSQYDVYAIKGKGRKRKRLRTSVCGLR